MRSKIACVPIASCMGSSSERAIELLRKLYAPFNRNHDRTVVMDVRSAELTKYAANAMLATKISFMNEIANIAERVGADVELVRQGIGSDPRIGYHFIYPGAGYGGSCFPKDVQALERTARSVGYDARLLGAVEAVNQGQKTKLFEFILRHFGGNVSGTHRRAVGTRVQTQYRRYARSVKSSLDGSTVGSRRQCACL